MREPNLQGFAGAILSPVNYSEEEIVSQIQSSGHRPHFDTVFDP